MLEQDSFWENRLSGSPHRSKGFSADLKANVEQRLLESEHPVRRANRRKRSQAVVAVFGLLLVALLAPAWWLLSESGLFGPDSATELRLEVGSGGDRAAWIQMERQTYPATDQTIIQLVAALLGKQLGALGGGPAPTDTLWENAAQKKLFANYEMSSPALMEVSVSGRTEGEAQVSYVLALTLTADESSRFAESIRVDVSSASGLIWDAKIVEQAPKPDDSKQDGAIDEKGSRRLLLAQNSEYDARLYGVPEPNSGMIGSIELDIGGGKIVKRFEDWKIVANETYYPEIWVSDVTGDGEPEWLVQLVTGYGTAVKETTLKVLSPQLEEIPVSDPVAAVESSVQATVEHNGTERTYHFKTEQAEFVIPYKEDEAVYWFDAPVYGNIRDYSVYMGAIEAGLSVHTSPGSSPLTAIVRYEYVDGAFVAVEAELIDLN